MKITARFYVDGVKTVGAPTYHADTKRTGPDGEQTYEIVTMKAVYSSDTTDPNYSFSTATPNASAELWISNKEAWGAFKVGHMYDVVFSPAPAAP